jgi:hypothetical protein
MTTSETTFPWEIYIPDTKFWSSTDYRIARAFLAVFPLDETKTMPLDPKLNEKEKIQLFTKILREKYNSEEKKHTPLPLYDADYTLWKKLMSTMSTMAYFDKDVDEQENILRSMIVQEEKHDGKVSFSTLSGLSHVLEQKGEYEEAEKICRQVMPEFREHKALGVDSPQTLGNTRHLIQCVWKQGKEEEAQDLIKETYELIENMGKGKFAKYEIEEKEALDELVLDLQGWSKAAA